MSMFGNILIYVKLQIQICFNAWSLNLYHVLLPYPILYVGRHRYLPSWIINRQWVVLFSACHHKRIPTCAVTDWYTHSNHCQRRLTNNIESLCSHLCTTPPAKLTPIDLQPQLLNCQLNHCPLPSYCHYHL